MEHRKKGGASALKRLKLRVLSSLPGARGIRYLRKLCKARGDEMNALFEHALSKAACGLCIDLGANLGDYTLRMAAIADRAIAFEPDPWTADRLQDRVGAAQNVAVIEAAA